MINVASAADGEFDDREYKVKQILQENRRKYLIAWEDDEVTGEKFEPSWEPKEYANELAVRDWKERKKSRSGELFCSCVCFASCYFGGVSC